MDSLLLSKIFRDFDLRTSGSQISPSTELGSDVFLSQLFQRTTGTSKKLALSFSGEQTPRLFLRVLSALSNTDQSVNSCKASKSSHNVSQSRVSQPHGFHSHALEIALLSRFPFLKAYLPETKFYAKPLPLVVQRWATGKKLFLCPEAVPSAWRLLTRLHAESLVSSDALLAKHLDDSFTRARFFLNVQHVKTLRSFRSRALTLLSPQVCFCHGDFTPSNIIVSTENHDALNGARENCHFILLDWEDSFEQGSMYYDAFHFAFFLEIFSSGIKHLSTSADFDAFFLSVFTRINDSGSTYSLSREAFFTYLPFYLARRLSTYTQADKKSTWKDTYADFYLRCLLRCTSSSFSSSFSLGTQM